MAIGERIHHFRLLHGFTPVSYTHLSQRDLAHQLQLAGFDMDKNVITRIETNKRYVTDLELKALTEIFHVSYDYSIDGCEKKQP